jgi:hypothetical protein
LPRRIAARLERQQFVDIVAAMTASELKNLLERIKTWPEEAQNELVAVANQIERIAGRLCRNAR